MADPTPAAPAPQPPWTRQADYTVRCEWGPRAVEALAPWCRVVIVVDVLSFTTCVEIATARGATVFPYRFRDDGAARFAADRDALLAGHNEHGYSLRPTTLTRIEAGTRLVLPSPNGSTLSLAVGGTTALAGCLRNRTAVAEHAASCLQDLRRDAGGAIGVVPAGERWPGDGSLRPAFEDLCGAGAIIDALPAALSRSPDAAAAAALFRSLRDRLPEAIADCPSGLEKRARGHEADLPLATALDASDCVPLLSDGAYSSCSASTRSG